MPKMGLVMLRLNIDRRVKCLCPVLSFTDGKHVVMFKGRHSQIALCH